MTKTTQSWKIIGVTMSCWLPFMYFLHQPRMSREATMLIKAPLPSPEDTHCLSRCLTGIPLGNRICCSSLSSSQNDCIVELEGNLTICSVTTGRSPRPREVTERVQPVEVSPFPPSHHWACLLLPCFWAALTVKLNREFLQVRPHLVCSAPQVLRNSQAR